MSPKSLQHTEDQVNVPIGLEGLNHHEEARVSEKVTNIDQRLLHIFRRMNHVGAKDDVVGGWCKSLWFRILLNVQHFVGQLLSKRVKLLSCSEGEKVRKTLWLFFPCKWGTENLT